MTAIEVLHHLQTRDIQLTVDGHQLRYDAPESAITEGVLTLGNGHLWVKPPPLELVQA